MRNVVRTLILGILILGPLSCSLFAQGESGGITVSIKDSSGATVSGATVKITNQSTGKVERVSTSDADGSAVAQLLPPATYSVEISHPGFKQYRVAVPVRINETTKFVATLELGQVSEVVQVEATPTLHQH